MSFSFTSETAGPQSAENVIKISPYKYIVLSIQKEVNFKAILLPSPEGIIAALNRIIKTFENPIEIEVVKTRWEEIKNIQSQVS